jgi:hypothetical protein
MTSKSRRELDALVDALDEAPIDEELARETVAKLGIDVKALATTLRTKVAQTVAQHDAIDREKRIHEARKAYAIEIERLELRKRAAPATRDELLVTFQALLAKAPPNAVAMHFHKSESATDDELAELIRALQHLLDEDESE